MLRELRLQSLAKTAPVVREEKLRRDLNDGDIVALGAAAASLQTFAGRSDEARCAAELVGQLSQKPVEPILRDLFSLARLLR